MKYACVIQCLMVSGIFLFLFADLIVKLVQTQGNTFETRTLNAYIKQRNCSPSGNNIANEHE